MCERTQCESNMKAEQSSFTQCGRTCPGPPGTMAAAPVAEHALGAIAFAVGNKGERGGEEQEGHQVPVTRRQRTGRKRRQPSKEGGGRGETEECLKPKIP